MNHTTNNTFGVVACVFLVSSLLSPAHAQTEQRLEAVSQQEDAIEIMDAVVKRVFKRMLEDNPNYISEQVRVVPAGFMTASATGLSTTDSVPQVANNLAQRLATTLGTRVSSFNPDRKNVSGLVFVATSPPEISGPEARIKVRKWSPTGGGQFGHEVVGFKLKRNADAGWIVTEDVSYQHSNVGALPAGSKTIPGSGHANGVLPPNAVNEQPHISGEQKGLSEALSATLRRTGDLKSFAGSAPVAVQFVVGVDGQARDIRVHDVEEARAEKIKQALMDIRFVPGEHEGRPVPVFMYRELMLR